MTTLKSAFLPTIGVLLVLLFSSWKDGQDAIIGPLPPEPDYTDSSQWYIIGRGGEADLFYVISTETDDHVVGGDTCHLADTYNEALREKMAKEMVAVDSFYSDNKLNYFSPYFRQVSMNSWQTPDKAFVRLEVAMSDVLRSWQYYLEHLNQGRPFILAGFSQGAHAIKEIMKHMPDSVYQRMVAAYFIGFKMPQEDIDANPHIRLAEGANDTGVTISFNSVRSSDCLLYISEGTAACINPVNWRTDTVSTRFVNYGHRGNDTLSVRCDPESKHLIVSGWKKETVLPVIGRPGNYHHMELRFYYPYIRQNMADRVAAFFSKKEKECPCTPSRCR